MTKELKQLKIFLIFSLVLVSCNDGVTITPCLINAEDGTCVFHDKSKKSISEINNYTALSPDDVENILEWSERNCKVGSNDSK